MAITSFTIFARGDNAQEAFERATDAGLSSSSLEGRAILDKPGFVEIAAPAGMNQLRFAERLIAENDPRISGKHSPAGCVEIGYDDYTDARWFILFGRA